MLGPGPCCTPNLCTGKPPSHLPTLPARSAASLSGATFTLLPSEHKGTVLYAVFLVHVQLFYCVADFQYVNR